MNDIFEKSRQPGSSSTKKFLSRVITYQLSRHLDFKTYEVVFEGCLDKINPSSEKPDVVIYRKDDCHPVAAIEICKTENLTDSFVLSRKLRRQYNLEEFFIYDYEADLWCREARNFSESGFSYFFNLDLKGMVSLFLAENSTESSRR